MNERDPHLDLTEAPTPPGTVRQASEPGQDAGSPKEARRTPSASPGRGSGAPFTNEAILEKILHLEHQGKLHGIYPDIPAAVYNDPSFPGVRSSDLKTIIKENYERWTNKKFQEKTIPALKFGTAFHAKLSGEEFDFNSLNDNDQRLIKVMHHATLAHPTVREFVSFSVHELTFFAKCPLTGLLLRCRADLWHDQLKIPADWKTCQDASEDAFARDAKLYGYKISAAFYLRVIGLVFQANIPEFRIFACEKNNPWGIGTYSYSYEDCESTQEKIDIGLNRIKTAQSGGWKSYDLEPVRLKY